MSKGKKNTKKTGTLSNMMVAASLTKKYTVLEPFGDNARYDLVIDDNGTFHRVQSKTGKIVNGVIYFNTHSVTGSETKGFSCRNYHGQIEFFGVYVPTNNKCYLVPIKHTRKTYGRLQIDLLTPKHKKIKIRWAKDYEI